WRSTTENIKQKRGTAHILNPSALNAPYCFVVEGEIDCMSVDECGFACIGLGSASNIRKIFDFDTSKTVLILALDNDKAGGKATAELEKLCNQQKTPYIVAQNDIWDGCKDANELLLKDRQTLAENLHEHAKRALKLDKEQWQREHVPTMSDTVMTMHTLDDTGNSRRMYDLCGDVMRYCYTDRRWLCYRDGKWLYDAKGGVFVWADRVLESMKSELKLWAEHEGGAMFEDYKKHMKKTRSNNSKTAMVREFQHLVAVSPTELDSDKFLVNVQNGVLNLNDFSLKSHKPDFLMTRMLGTSMPENPKKSQKWLDFLNQIFDGDLELIRYIQKALGYSLSGDTSEQCAFFLYGTGRNGKSTFLEVVRKIMGDYATNIQPESIMVKSNTNSANSDIARLKGARLVTSVEPNEGMRLNEGLLKQLTGDDMITARKLYGDEFEFRPEFKLWMATNHKPTIRGTDLGIWRRIHIIPFSVTIPEMAVDRKLSQKLEKELPDILAWAVEGYKLWKMEGLRMPKVIADAVEEYRNEMDVISAFLASDYVVQGGEVKAQALYAIYCQWCSESNEYKMSSTKFGREIAKRYNKIKKMAGWFYQGISLDNISIG
ncbi:MAG: toprim domain-containing protein, partial [Ruminococcus sp.]|nr:toprim domain-containing protein [Ruminococcus sp.]